MTSIADARSTSPAYQARSRSAPAGGSRSRRRIGGASLAAPQPLSWSPALPTETGMAVLRRATSTILGWTVLATTAVVLVLGAVGISDRPDPRLPALAGWVMLATIVHALAGERASRSTILFAALLSLPVVATAVAAHEAHERWNMPASWASGPSSSCSRWSGRSSSAR